MNFLSKAVNNLFKFSAQDSDLEYLCWRCKNFPVSSDLKPPLELVVEHDWNPMIHKFELPYGFGAKIQKYQSQYKKNYKTKKNI